jgi:hypothetical protein
MGTRTKHQELEDELGVLREEVRAIGQKQDQIQDQLESVNGRLESVETLEVKVDRMETLLLKNDQVQSDIVGFLKRLDGKISHPPTPETVFPGTSSTVREQAVLLNQHAIAKDIHARTCAVADLQTASKHTLFVEVENSPLAKHASVAPGNNTMALTVSEKPQTAQYKSDRAAQFMKSIAKGPKIDFPSFNGDNPLGWIRQVNKYFELSQVPDECKTDLAQTYIVGRADNWLRSTKILQTETTWESFCRLICDRFAQSSIYEILERFHAVKQYLLSVSDYTDKFEEIMAVIRDEHPYLQEHYYIVNFVNGLKPEIKCNLRPQRPKTLSDAYWMARDYESGLLAAARAQKFPAALPYR